MKGKPPFMLAALCVSSAMRAKYSGAMTANTSKPDRRTYVGLFHKKTEEDRYGEKIAIAAQPPAIQHNHKKKSGVQSRCNPLQLR
ncbi:MULTISPECIES: hypothetical protein [unclassified Paenibacillus]|uniref:hypothetical protein n=1 Tax=Paenibacillus TaxID=44249 RepID=UPI0012ECE1FF|nr:MULTISPECIES: hypothetical protein [unclassified Paenibacillus]